jgi:hypothetical protein
MNNRRNFIRSTAAASAGLLASDAFAFSIGNKHAAPAELIIGHNGFNYGVDKGWAKISASTHPVINCHEMVQDSKGRLFMIHTTTFWYLISPDNSLIPGELHFRRVMDLHSVKREKRIFC